MSQTLFLTANEKKIFDMLPADVKKGWSVKAEKRVFKDSKEDFRLRWTKIRFKSEKLRTLERKLASAKSMADVQKGMANVDLSDLPKEDIIGTLFIGGPDMVGAAILSALVAVRSSTDLTRIVSLIEARSVLLDAFVTI